MNRDSKTPAALLALARTRRMQRAMAHAYLHRNEPIPTLRGTLHFVTDTTCVTDDVAPARGHQMRVLGVAMAERVAYVVEDLGDADEAPIVYRLWLDGPRAGHLVPIHAWYEQCDDPAEIRARIAAIEPTLEPLMHATTELWMLSTRVVQHRALRVAPPARESIRKFALQLKVEPVARGPSGHATVTAFMRPNATLSDVWMLTSGDAIARITYTGIPSGVGLTKDTMVLLTG
nr:hypothetical protein [Kofleriaceae bacterium]